MRGQGVSRAATVPLCGADPLYHPGVYDSDGAQPEARGARADGGDIPQVCHGGGLTQDGVCRDAEKGGAKRGREATGRMTPDRAYQPG